mgnify:CR=1 FL=1
MFHTSTLRCARPASPRQLKGSTFWGHTHLPKYKSRLIVADVPGDYVIPGFLFYMAGNICWSLFSATVEELCEVDGVGENAAALIALVPEIMKKSRLSKTREIKQIRSSDDAGAYLLPWFMNEKDEVVYLLCLDAKRAVICCAEVGRGVVNSVDANIRRIVEKALKVRACSVIIAHNHPDGLALPSREDDIFTRALYNALETVGIRLEDHIIVADEDYISIADTGMLYLSKY